MRRYKHTLELYPGAGLDFDLRLPIRRFADFEDEPTLPRGLCHWTDEEDTDVNLPRFVKVLP